MLASKSLWSWSGLAEDRGWHFGACVVLRPRPTPSLIELLEKTNQKEDDGEAEEEELVYNELLDEDE